MSDETRMNRARADWGIVTLGQSVCAPDGTWWGAVFGFVEIVTDKEWGDGFRSSERWQAIIHPTDSVFVGKCFIIPGCMVKGIVITQGPPPHGVYDSTRMAPDSYRSPWAREKVIECRTTPNS